MTLDGMGSRSIPTTIKHNDICLQYALPFGWFQCVNWFSIWLHWAIFFRYSANPFHPTRIPLLL
jgi:hypothetical protein